VPATSPRTCKVAGGLERDAAAPGFALRGAIASGRGPHLLDTSGDVGEGEGALFVAGFEIDAAFVEFDFLQMVAGVGGALRAIGNCRGGGF